MTTSCVICGGQMQFHAMANDIEYFTIPQPIQYDRCNACGILQANPMMADQLGVIYPANYYSFRPGEENFVHKIKQWLDRRAYKKILTDIPGQNLRILDVGGGSGFVAGLVRDCDARVTNTMIVDIDAKAEEFARASNHDFFCGRFEEFQSPEKYDLILMLNLIEHVADPSGMLSKARDLLSDTGVILIQTPNTNSLDARLFKNQSWGGYHAPRHFVLFNKENFLSLTSKLGLKTQSFHYIQGAPFWSVSALNILRKMGLAKVSKDRPAIYNPIMPLLQAFFAAFDMARGVLMPTSQMVIVLKKN